MNVEDVVSIHIKQYKDSVFPNAEILRYKNLEYLVVSGFSYLGRKSELKPFEITIDTLGFKQLKSLKYLKIVSLNLKGISNHFSELTNLEHLELDLCNLSEVPKGLSNLRKLKEISFRLNNISEVGNEIIDLDSLEYLDLANNSFTIFPKEIALLKSINVINLSNAETTNEVPISKYSPFGVNINEIDYFNQVNELIEVLQNKSLSKIAIFVKTDLDKEDVKIRIGDKIQRNKLAIQTQ
ncbi:MAG: hypothetical protein H6587_05115 [Flavobacteriales bacterium]|nr:hypothetical protein [Flavobacteriales bacterium]MCB9363931.1 hypothetical protein [Flavobacteriales bacterium]